MKLFSQTSPVDSFNEVVNFRTAEALQSKRIRQQFVAHREIDLQFPRSASLQTVTTQVIGSKLGITSDSQWECRVYTPLSDFKTLRAFKPTFLRSW